MRTLQGERHIKGRYPTHGIFRCRTTDARQLMYFCLCPNEDVLRTKTLQAMISFSLGTCLLAISTSLSVAFQSGVKNGEGGRDGEACERSGGECETSALWLKDAA